MGGSRAGSVGSYSSASANPVGDVLGKYGNDALEGKIAKVEKDIMSAEKSAEKQQKQLKEAAAGKKAEEIKGLEDGGSDSDGSSTRIDERNVEDENVENIAESLVKRSPEETFAQFDTDGSGLIDFDEFRAMLHQLGIKMSMPKALKYFRVCDRDGTGEIDLEEFKVALFAVDPDSGNPVGFTPNALLTPLDAFEMFDEDNSGRIDEDQLFFLLQYLGLDVPEAKQEQMFNKYDADKSGYIGYAEFKKIWVRLANVKKELTDRGVKIPKLATKTMILNTLEQILDMEEERERRAIAEAERWAKWQMLLKDKRRAYEKARRLSTTELNSALDAGGSVWVFGTGPFGEFSAPAPKVLTQGGHTVEHYDVIRDMWNMRVNPPPKAAEPVALGRKHERRRRKEAGHAAFDETTGRAGDSADEKEPTGVFAGDRNNHQDPEEDASTSPFAGLCVARSTAALWGRRIVSVTTSDSTAFAVSELGEVLKRQGAGGYAWGGKDHWWFDIGPDSYWQSHWRGDTTERSRLLLQTVDKVEPAEVEPEQEIDKEEQEIEKLRTLTTYYGVWKPPPTIQRRKYIQDELIPRITQQQVSYSLQCRGKHVEGMNKKELLDLLYEDIVLEKKILGERLHRRIRQLELETTHMYKKGRNVMGKSLRLEIEEMWTPLREVQAEDAAVKRANEEAIQGTQYAESEERYVRWRDHLRKARDETTLVFTSRGNSLKINLGGITDRGGGIQTPRANGAAVAITAGANHVLMVHRSGQLYTWGVGASGRLGLDLFQGGNPQGDAASATVIQAFTGRPVIRASAGYNHSAAITSSGWLYSWGSAATGKLGLGTVDRDVYCSVPTRVMVDTTSKIKELSCGAAHTACVSASGQLFVWGCGDGGRLGLGEDRLGLQYEPVLVEALLDVRIGHVSCGNSHTLALIAVREVFEGEGVGKAKVRLGGGVMQAGSTNVLGKFCPAFTPVQGLDRHTVRQVSAGYGHSCCVTTEGELYTWGSNRDGCLGLVRAVKFANFPTLVSCLYQSPKNLALNRPARQSSVYDNLEAAIVVDGDCSGDDSRKCNCTQQDPQGWWEVDLGELAHVHQVKIWNRCDEPLDPSLERSLYAKRLFPCWVMVSQDPFGDDVGGAALLDAINIAVARTHLKEPTKEQRCSAWRCPEQTMARYVRVQLEGFDFLHLAQVEVFGTTGARRSPGRVTHSCAGKYVTTVVLAASDNPADVELLYKKAVQADAFNAEVLRQLETFFFAYDAWGRGDAIRGCLLCKTGNICEVCALKHEFREELRDLPLGPGGSVRPLAGIAQYLFDREKPNLEYQTPTKKRAGVLNTMRGGISKIFAPLQGSIGGSTGDSSTSTGSDMPDSMTTLLPSKKGEGEVMPNRHKGKNSKKRRAAAVAAAASGADSADDGSCSIATSGSAVVNRANREYHVGPLKGGGGSLSSSRSSSTTTTMTTNTASGSSVARGRGSSGGLDGSVHSEQSAVRRRGGSTDKSEATLGSSTTNGGSSAGDGSGSSTGSSTCSSSGSIGDSSNGSSRDSASAADGSSASTGQKSPSKKGGKPTQKKLRVSAIG